MLARSQEVEKKPCQPLQRAIQRGLGRIWTRVGACWSSLRLRLHTTTNLCVSPRPAKDIPLVEEIFHELVLNFECPRLTQVRSWQLFSLCTNDYEQAKDHLESSLRLIDSLEQTPSIVRLSSGHFWCFSKNETCRDTLHASVCRYATYLC